MENTNTIASESNTKKEQKIFSTEEIKKIFNNTEYKVWINPRNEEVRLYHQGGNNYHYEGSWYLVIDNSLNCLDSNCYLKIGYGNKNSAEYVSKYCEEASNKYNEMLPYILDKFFEQNVELDKQSDLDFKTEVNEDNHDWLKFSKKAKKTKNGEVVKKDSDPDFENFIKNKNSLKVIKNKYYKTNKKVNCVVNLSESAFIDFYHGVGGELDTAVAYVDKDKNDLYLWHYGSVASSNLIDKIKEVNNVEISVYFVVPSCTQLCFINKYEN